MPTRSALVLPDAAELLTPRPDGPLRRMSRRCNDVPGCTGPSDPVASRTIGAFRVGRRARYCDAFARRPGGLRSPDAMRLAEPPKIDAPRAPDCRAGVLAGLGLALAAPASPPTARDPAAAAGRTCRPNASPTRRRRRRPGRPRRSDAGIRPTATPPGSDADPDPADADPRARRIGDQPVPRERRWSASTRTLVRARPRRRSMWNLDRRHVERDATRARRPCTRRSASTTGTSYKTRRQRRPGLGLGAAQLHRPALPVARRITSKTAAIKAIAAAIDRTDHPVGITVHHGTHAWVVLGYKVQPRPRPDQADDPRVLRQGPLGPGSQRPVEVPLHLDGVVPQGLRQVPREDPQGHLGTEVRPRQRLTPPCRGPGGRRGRP